MLNQARIIKKDNDVYLEVKIRTEFIHFLISPADTKDLDITQVELLSNIFNIDLQYKGE